MAHISLFSRFAIEVLVIGLGILSGMMNNAVPMIRRRIECIEFQWNTAGIDDIVIRSRRDNYRKAGHTKIALAVAAALIGTFISAILQT